MVTVTDEAREELKRTLAGANLGDPAMALRLAIGDAGDLQLQADVEHEGDQVVEHAGSKVLLLGSDISLLLDGFIIDCEDTDDGPSLVFIDPNGGGCDCGECGDSCHDSFDDSCDE